MDNPLSSMVRPFKDLLILLDNPLNNPYTEIPTPTITTRLMSPAKNVLAAVSTFTGVKKKKSIAQVIKPIFAFNQAT